MNKADFAIAEAILDTSCDGMFDIDVEIRDNVFASVCGNMYKTSCREDDDLCECANGAGAWMTCYAYVCINYLEIHSYDNDGNEKECDIEVHESEIEKYCREQMLCN